MNTITRLLLRAAQLTVVLPAALVAAAPITDASVERVDPRHVVVSWTASAPIDVYSSERPDADWKTATLLRRGDRDGRYESRVETDRRRYFLLRDAADGNAVHVSERVLQLEHGSNFRDLGGYAAESGKRVRWGQIYRSGATPLLSDRDLKYVATLGLAAMVDLRSTEERELAPTRLTALGLPYVAVDYSVAPLLHGPPADVDAKAWAAAHNGYRTLLTTLAPQYRAIFLELLSRKGAVVFNCTAGQDRTGIAAALVLSALGVPRTTILEDYHLSTRYRHPEYEMPPTDPVKDADNPVARLWSEARNAKPKPLYWPDGRSMLADTFDEIDTRWGSIDNFLSQVLNIDAAQLAMLRGTLLE